MSVKLHIKKGATVLVLSGNSKGTKSEVLHMLPKEGKAIVKGVNVVKKHIKPTSYNPQGKIEEVEAPIHLSKLMLVDGSGTPTRVGRKQDENGKWVRYSKKTGDLI